MNILLNYSDKNYRLQQKYNTLTGKYISGFDHIIETSIKDLDKDFIYKNRDILNISRGAGLWLWKPYIIYKHLQLINTNDFLFYCDSGSIFIRKIQHLVDFMNSQKKDILLFDNPLLEKQFCKKNLYDLFSPENNNQICGGYLLVRKTDLTLSFIKEWLDMCCNINFLYDNGQDVENPDYISHREDQAILSLLAHKHRIVSYRDPSQYGKRPWEYMNIGRYYRNLKHQESKYPQILINCRNQHPLRFLFTEIIKYILYSVGIFSERQYINKHLYNIIMKNGEKYIDF